MAIRQFDIGPSRGLQRAAADDLPNLVVIAGPNGSGKSTLLHALYKQRHSLDESGSTVSYLGPHRGWRKMQLASSVLSEFQPEYRKYLELEEVPGWQQHQPRGLGRVAVGEARDPGGLDESFSFVKPAISKLETRLHRLLRDTWANQGEQIQRGDVPDLLEPLRRLVRSLLPHLDVKRVDISDESNMKVIFRRVDGAADALVELDELSSGEKAVVGLMLPFVEDEASRLAGDAPNDESVPVMIIDEPESHLHPTLQILLVDFLSELAEQGVGQFIIATQSPSILDALDDFYLLSPNAAASDGNHLARITNEAGRLEAMRALTGSTHLLTRCRPIVFIEGEKPASRAVSDQRLVEALIPQASGWVLVAAQGRAEVARSAQQLRQAMASDMPGILVFAVVDGDRAAAGDQAYVVNWPVAMVENLLLQPEAIWAVLAPHRERLLLTCEEDVERELRRIGGERRADEVRLRVDSLQRPISVRVKPDGLESIDDAIAVARESANDMLDQLSADGNLSGEVASAEEAVQRILDEKRELEAFRGKEILRTFFDLHAKHAVNSYRLFALTVAREARGAARTKAIVDDVVRRIEQFVPVDGLEAAKSAQTALAATDHRDLADEVITLGDAARDAWDDPNSEAVDLSELRRGWLSLAGAIAETEPTIARRLRECAAELGVRSSTVT